MSFSLSISGHHPSDNAVVKQIAEEAVQRLRAAGCTSVGLNGFAYNGTERVELSTPAEIQKEEMNGGEKEEASS